MDEVIKSNEVKCTNCPAGGYLMKRKWEGKE